MSYVKRQATRKRNRQTLGTLSKSSDVRQIECQQTEYVTRYGKKWLRRWWDDHSGLCDMTPFCADPRKVVDTGLGALVFLAKPLELIKSDKHPLFVHGYGTVDLDGWVFKAKITAMGDPAEHLLTAETISAIGTLRKSPNGYQFSVREVLPKTKDATA